MVLWTSIQESNIQQRPSSPLKGVRQASSHNARATFSSYRDYSSSVLVTTSVILQHIQHRSGRSQDNDTTDPGISKGSLASAKIVRGT